jgi:hypothetical protein
MLLKKDKMSHEIINKGFEATENKRLSFEAIFCIVVGLLVLMNIVFASLYVHSLSKEKQYEIKLNEKDSINAELQSLNNILNYEHTRKSN